MASLNMQGPYDLTNSSIDTNVTKKSAGNYALGRAEKDTFYVDYVGRSDTDVNARLKTWVGKKYKSFKFSYAQSSKSAFEKECNNFHDFGGIEQLDNDIHPDRPADSDWKCPQCDAFD